MNTSRALIPLILLLLLLLLQTAVSSSSTSPNKIPRLSLLHKQASRSVGVDDSLNLSDFKRGYYTQTLDHFNYAPQSYANFSQKYYVNSKYWGPPNSPIFAYLGAEQPLGLGLISYLGFINDNAPSFNALTVFIEVIINMHAYFYTN